MLGLANTLVQAAKQYEGLAGYLLGRVVVVDTIDNAIALARKYRYSLRIVTLEGELLSAGGSMTGGAFKTAAICWDAAGKWRSLGKRSGKP